MAAYCRSSPWNRTQDDPLLVGPWLEGGSLLDVTVPLTPEEAVVLADGLASALDALHAKGWSHGDVSPGNVLFAAGSLRPVLGDLGNARRLGARAPARALVVTPHVTAPEVWAGDRVDGRADLYSLGTLLYWALTGAWPFVGSGVDAFADLHRSTAVPPLPDAPEVEAVLLRALAKAPGERFASGAELAGALRVALERPAVMPRREPHPPPGRCGGGETAGRLRRDARRARAGRAPSAPRALGRCAGSCS